MQSPKPEKRLDKHISTKIKMFTFSNNDVSGKIIQGMKEEIRDLLSDNTAYEKEAGILMLLEASP